MISVRPAPTSPQNPITSPDLTLKEMSRPVIDLQIAHLEHDVANFCIPFREKVLQFPADHHVGDLSLIVSSWVYGVHIMAVL